MARVLDWAVHAAYMLRDEPVLQHAVLPLQRRHYSFDCSINYYRLSSAHYSTWQQTAHRFMCVQSAPSYAEYSSSPAEY